MTPFTLWGHYKALYFKMLSDVTVESACSYVRTCQCQKVRGEENATICHFQGLYLHLLNQKDLGKIKRLTRFLVLSFASWLIIWNTFIKQHSKTVKLWSLFTLWGHFKASCFKKLLNDARVTSACSNIRTCQRVRNSKKKKPYRLHPGGLFPHQFD